MNFTEKIFAHGRFTIEKKLELIKVTVPENLTSHLNFSEERIFILSFWIRLSQKLMKLGH